MMVTIQSLKSIPLLFVLTWNILASCSLLNKPGLDTSSNNLNSTTAENVSKRTCPVTEPAWVKPPADPAVDGTPEYGYYFVNQDGSIWASAWWTGQEETYLRAGDEGVKIGWFRPEGADLEITGQRLDSPAAALDAHIPCCYPTRFQSSGLFFPTQGCWEVIGKAAESKLSFILLVDP